MQIEEDASAVSFNHRQSTIHLFLTVARNRTKHVTGKAMGMHANEDVVTIFDGPLDQRDMSLAINSAFERDHAELSMTRGQNGFTDFANEPFCLQPIANQIRHGNHLKSVQFGEFK